MVQNPKGGGLSSSIGGSQMLGGVQKTTDFLDKSTWTLATILIVLVMLSSLSFTGEADKKLIDETETSAPAGVPAMPKDNAATTPAATTPATTTPVQAEPVTPAPAE